MSYAKRYNLDLDDFDCVPAHPEIPTEAHGKKVLNVVKHDDTTFIVTKGYDGHICQGFCLMTVMGGYKLCPKCESVKFDATPLEDG